MSIQIKTKAIPSNPRSKNYPAGSAIVNSGGGGGSTTIGGGGGESASLTKDIKVNSPQTGHISIGTVLTKGMSPEQVFRKIFYKPVPATLVGRLSTANDVEYGTSKGAISYTATRNDNGKMQKAYFDNNEVNKLEFSEEVNGVQNATRQLTGIYTVGESYTATVIYSASETGDLLETVLNDKISVNVRRKWFAGVCNAVPTTSSEVRALASSGLYTGSGTYKFTISNYQTFVICIPTGSIKEVTLARYVYNFMDMDSASTPVKVSVEGANGSAASEYTMYIFSSKTVSPETDNFTFKTV